MLASCVWRILSNRMLGILKFWALRRKWKMLALFLSPLHGPSQLISFKWKPEKFLRQKWRVDWPGLISDLNCYVSRTQTYSSIVSYIEPQCISVLLFLFAGLTIKVCLYEEPDHLPVHTEEPYTPKMIFVTFCPNVAGHVWGSTMVTGASTSFVLEWCTVVN